MKAEFNPVDAMEEYCLETERAAFHTAMTRNPKMINTAYSKLATIYFINDSSHTWVTEALETAFPKAEVRISGDDGVELTIRATRNNKEGEELSILFPRRDKGYSVCQKKRCLGSRVSSAIAKAAAVFRS